VNIEMRFGFVVQTDIELVIDAASWPLRMRGYRQSHGWRHAAPTVDSQPLWGNSSPREALSVAEATPSRERSTSKSRLGQARKITVGGMMSLLQAEQRTVIE
jgi:hypothetical protein